MVDLEGAAIANGGNERDLHPEHVCRPELDRDLRPEGGRGKGGDGALLHGIGGEPTWREKRRPGDGRGSSRDIVGRPGIMRGRPMERERDFREPVMVDPRMPRPGEEQGGRQVPKLSDGRDLRVRQVPRPSDARELPREQRAPRPGEDQAHQQDRLARENEQNGEEGEWEAAVRRSGILGAGSQEVAEAARAGGDASRRWTWSGRGLDLES